VDYGTATPTSLYGVWGTASNDVFVVGESTSPILHYTGTWSQTPPPGGVSWLWSVWGSSTSDVYALGSSGKFPHYNGSTWSLLTPTTASMRSVWGTQGSTPFAVGGAGTILRGVRGASATTYGYTAELTSISSAATGSIWATPITVGSKTELDSLGYVVKLGGVAMDVRMALYSNLSGHPDRLLGQTGVFSVGTAAATYRVSLTAQVQVQPGIYWLAVTHSASGAGFGYELTGGPGMAVYSPFTWGTAFPSTLGVPPSTIASYKLNFYARGFLVP